VKLQYLGNTVGNINSVAIEGNDDGVFAYTADQTLTDQMSPGDSRYVDVYFTPIETPRRNSERKYSAEIVVKYSVWGEKKETRHAIEGTAVQPQVQITNQDWGIRQINTTTSLPIDISNINPYAFSPLTNNEGGTMDLIIDSLIISDGTPFVWTSTGSKKMYFNPPARIGGLLSKQLLVDFTPITPGKFRAQYRLYGNVLDTNFATLEGETIGESKIEPIHLITWIGTTTSGKLRGKIAYPTLLKFKEFRGGDYVLFSPSQSSSLTPFPVDANVEFEFGIDFRPDKVTEAGLKPGQSLKGRLPYQNNVFSTNIVFEDASGNEIIGEVSGDGKYLETTLRIICPKNTVIGETNEISFILQPTPESIDSGGVESARLRVLFDEDVITPIGKKTFPTAINFEESKFMGMIEIDLVTPPQVDGFLGSYDFGGLLSTKSFTTVEGLYYTIDKGGKQGSPYVVVNIIPDEFTIIPVCANVKRVVDFVNPSSMIVKNNMIEVTVGFDAPLRLTSVNELGQQFVLFSGFVKKGTYYFSTQDKGLQWIIARHGNWIETLGIIVD